MKISFKIIKTGSGNDTYFTTLGEGLKRSGISVAYYYYPKICQYFPIIMLLLNRKTDGDIIHSNIEYAWAVKENGKPLVSTAHHLVFDKEFQKYTSVWQKISHYLVLLPSTYLSINASEKIIAVSKYTRDEIYRVFKNASNVEVIYNGIDLAIFKPLRINKYNTDGRHHLIFVGNLISRKGADLLPKIMKGLGDSYVLHYTSGLRSTPPRGFDLPNMIPLGKLTTAQLAKEYNKCDALLFPTRLEGFGYAVAEAIACGIPVIASNNSSITEIVTPENNGILCKTNQVKLFIVSIVKLLGKGACGGNNLDFLRTSKKDKSTMNAIHNYELIYKQYV
ncbi:MAG: glycosyltransferase family 4 protein [bacterium]